MKKTVTLTLILALLFSAVAGTHFVKPAMAETITVPDDYATIQDAINAAAEGDTILVQKGTYEEHTLIINKTLTLVGEDANNTTIKNIDELPHWDMVNPFPPPKPDAIQISADDVKISGFTITSTSKDSGSTTKGISATGKGIQIVGNIIRDFTGCNSWEAIDVTGDGAQVLSNAVLGENVWIGISVTGAHQTVAQNNIKGGSRCIDSTGQYNTIVGNTVFGGSTGIDLSGDFNVIYNNTVTNQIDGIGFEGSCNVIAENNITENEVIGIIMTSSESQNNTICKNYVTNSRDGIEVMGKNNTIYANYIADNQIGITVLRDRVWMDHYAFNNTFYHNNFVGNGQGAADWSWQGTNAWDNGAEGNYWSDYNGTDANGDGIGDTFYTVNSPYTINYNSGPTLYDPKIVNTNEVFDRYPLMAPFDISTVEIELPEWAYPLPSPSPSLEPTSKSAPFPTALVIALVITITVEGIGLLIYFKKRKR